MSLCCDTPETYRDWLVCLVNLLQRKPTVWGVHFKAQVPGPVIEICRETRDIQVRNCYFENVSGEGS